MILLCKRLSVGGGSWISKNTNIIYFYKMFKNIILFYKRVYFSKKFQRRLISFLNKIQSINMYQINTAMNCILFLATSIYLINISKRCILIVKKAN